MANTDALQANIGMNSQKLVISTGSTLPDVDDSELKPINWSTSKNTIGRPLVTPVMNHQNCGNCWAITSTSLLANRLIVQSALAGNNVGTGTVNFQPALTTQCVSETLNNGCNGGSVYYAGKYFETKGASQITGAEPSWDAICSTQCGNLPSCQVLTPQFSSSKVYKAKGGSTTTLSASNTDGSVDVQTTITNIKKALLGGPVIGQIFCANDLIYDFNTSKIWSDPQYGTNGIYINGKYNVGLDLKYPHVKLGAAWADIQVDSDGNPSAHAVEVVGWDIDPKYGPYWIVKNNWGPDWNGTGFFNYAMYPNNKLIALDIPIPDAIRASTGSVIKNIRPKSDINVEDLFGGCLYFDPDGVVGNDPNYLSYQPVIKPPQPPQTQQSPGVETTRIEIKLNPAITNAIESHPEALNFLQRHKFHLLVIGVILFVILLILLFA
jgi:Papain family cysteine protease